jgi:hypothetical protein
LPDNPPRPSLDSILKAYERVSELLSARISGRTEAAQLPALETLLDQRDQLLQTLQEQSAELSSASEASKQQLQKLLARDQTLIEHVQLLMAQVQIDMQDLGRQHNATASYLRHGLVPDQETSHYFEREG